MTMQCGFSRGSVYSYCLYLVAMSFVRLVRCCLGEAALSERKLLAKADIDAAFRRIPIAPGQRHFAHVVYLVNGKPRVAGHNAFPFGSSASVHWWDRVGEFFAHFLLCMVHAVVLVCQVHSSGQWLESY